MSTVGTGSHLHSGIGPHAMACRHNSPSACSAGQTPVSLAAALRHHARDLPRPFTTSQSRTDEPDITTEHRLYSRSLL